MTVYSNSDPVLMGEETWEIRTASEHAKTLDLQSYIIHDCPQLEGHRYWWSLDLLDTPCMGCDKLPPENIMTVWKLHNWDYIQNGGHR